MVERVKRVGIAVACVGGLALIWAPSAFAFDCNVRLDSFNRADSSTLGSKWTEQAPNIGVENKRATNPNASTALATFKGRKAQEACVDVAINGTGTQYVAIVLGYADLTTNNLFIKLQNQNSIATFDTAYFYGGNNGSELVPNQSIKSVTPFASGRIHVLWFGSTVRLDIDTNFDNKPEQSLTLKGVPTASLGTGIGLGVYGHAFADNFSIGLPKTKITSARFNRAKNRAKFRFSSSERGSSFLCKLDNRAYKQCGSPKTYRHLSAGGHIFRVKARDGVGNVDPTPAKRAFSI